MDKPWKNESCCDECKAGSENDLLDGLRSRLASLNRPISNVVRSKSSTRDFSFEHTGKKGDVVILNQFFDDVLFRGEKLMTTDSLKGEGTQLHYCRVDHKDNFPPGPHMTKKVEPPGSLSCGIKFDVVHPGMPISFKIEFLEDCTYSLAMFGRTVQP